MISFFKATTFRMGMGAFTALLIVLCTSCTSQDDSSGNALVPENTVILISIDGFLVNYLETIRPPNLVQLAANGVSAPEGMISVFPTLTFPNHYSIATGLYSENHGIISNTMYDPTIDAWFRLSDRDAVEDTHWWEGEPIWVTAELQGMTAATFYFVGSEAPVKNVQPTYWRRFDASVPGEDRVDQVLAWLDLPAEEKPGFISLYFGQVDGVGHSYGPSAPETADAVRNVDGYIGRLLAGLEERGIDDRVDIVVVSDHGMSDRSQDRVIALDDFIDLEDVQMISTSPVLMLNTPNGNRDAILSSLQGAHANLQVWAKEDVPERFHYGGHYRTPDIIGLVDDGWTMYRTRSYMNENLHRLGGSTHGYDPAALSMRALFIANGPSFKSGMEIDPFENIHIYEMLAKILGLDPAENDGDPDVLSPILKN